MSTRGRHSRALLWTLSEASANVEERMRTAFLAIIALLSLGAMLYFLRPALLPLVLAVIAALIWPQKS